jgi:hypothetical protein
MTSRGVSERIGRASRELRRGQLKRFSLETLIRYLERLDHRVEVNVTHARPNYRRSNESCEKSAHS